MIDRNNRPPSQSIDTPRDGERMNTPDSIKEEPSDTAEPEDTGRDQSQVAPDDYPKHDGGRPDYGSPHRRDDAQDPDKG